MTEVILPAGNILTLQAAASIFITALLSSLFFRGHQAMRWGIWFCMWQLLTPPAKFFPDAAFMVSGWFLVEFITSKIMALVQGEEIAK